MPTARRGGGRGHLSVGRPDILDLLIGQPGPRTVGALSVLTGQHPNTIREHLNALVDRRLAVRARAPRQSRGRPAWLYSTTPEVGSELGIQEYAGLASALAAHIARTSRHPHADATEAGRRWGRELMRRPAVAAGDGSIPGVAIAPSAIAARRQVVTLLEDLGFAPSPDARAGVVTLRRCPLREAAHQHPEVVCAVHLGLVRGAFDELGTDPDRTERTALQPFSEPGACRLILLPRSATAR